MKIKRITENIELSTVANIIEDIITPFSDKLELDHFEVHLSSKNAIFKIYKSLNNDTYKDYMNLFDSFDKYGLNWYIDNEDCFVDLSKYNDEMTLNINSKKFNL